MAQSVSFALILSKNLGEVDKAFDVLVVVLTKDDFFDPIKIGQ